MAADLSERTERLWVPVAAPVIWGVHFTICYITVALLCGRFSSVGDAGTLRLTIAIYTAIAIVAMVFLFVRGWRRHRSEWPDRPHDEDTPEDRRHFLAFTTMLLAGLSIIGTAFVALAVVIVDRCP